MTTPSRRRNIAMIAAWLFCGGGLAAQQGTEGFRVGDRILLRVEGETQLSDTFTVGPGPALSLPVIGAISLQGVQRAGVEAYLTEQLGRFIKTPIVHARALIRVSVLGEVTKPGFYAVPADLVLSDALMLAGGPTHEANVAALRVERSGDHLGTGTVQDAIARGATLNDLGLHSGDKITVPRVARRDAEATFRTLALILTIPATIFGLAKIL